MENVFVCCNGSFMVMTENGREGFTTFLWLEALVVVIQARPFQNVFKRATIYLIQGVSSICDIIDFLYSINKLDAWTPSCWSCLCGLIGTLIKMKKKE